MTKPRIKWRDVEGLLTQLNFKLVKGSPGSHRVYRLKKGNVVIILPYRSKNEIVSAAHLAAIRRRLFSDDVIQDQEFERALARQRSRH